MLVSERSVQTPSRFISKSIFNKKITNPAHVNNVYFIAGLKYKIRSIFVSTSVSRQLAGDPIVDS